MALNGRLLVFLALFVTVTFACSASSKSGASEPESLGVTAPGPSRPEVAAAQQPCPPAPAPVCPSAPDPVPEPTPAPAPDPTLAAQQARLSRPAVLAVLDPANWPPTMKGWYCFELRRKRGDKSFISECERTVELCAEERAEMAVKIKRYKGAQLGACKPYSRASCFTYQAPVRKLSAMSCHRTSMECLSAWGDTANEHPDFLRSMCVDDIE